MKKIRDFILQSGYSLTLLEKKTGIPLVKLKNFLSENIEPTLADVRKLAKALNVPISFIVTENKDVDKVKVLFRNEITTEKNIYEADRFSLLIGNSFSLLGNYVEDKILKKYFPPIENTSENARLLAMKFREVYLKGDQIGPLFNLPKILSEELKCIIYVTEIGADGASAYINKVPFIFISPRFKSRMLFTCAHELGHILGHYNKNEDFAFYDQDVFHTGEKLKKEKQLQERFANEFAAHLLLPEQGVGVALKTIRKHILNKSDSIGDVEILYLCRFYGVSFDVAAMRLERLNILPKGGARSLSEEIKSKYGSAEKRAEALNLPPRQEIEFPRVSPTLIENAIEKISNGDISIGKASEILSLPIQDILDKNAFFAE